MKIQKPIIKLWLVASVFYTLLLGTAWAVELIVPLPGTEKDIADPAVYVRNLYTFGIGLAALFAMAQIVFGGVQYTVSAGNPSLQGDAKDRILNAIYGLVLLLTAFLILQTVNTKLTTLTIEGVKPLPGVDKFAYQSISDLQTDILKQSEQIAGEKAVEANKRRQAVKKESVEIAAKYKDARYNLEQATIAAFPRGKPGEQRAALDAYNKALYEGKIEKAPPDEFNYLSTLQAEKETQIATGKNAIEERRVRQAELSASSGVLNARREQQRGFGIIESDAEEGYRLQIDKNTAEALPINSEIAQYEQLIQKLEREREKIKERIDEAYPLAL